MSEIPASSPGSLVWRQLLRHRLAMVCLVVVLFMTAVCLAAPLIAPYAFDAIDLGNIRQAPSRIVGETSAVRPSILILAGPRGGPSAAFATAD
jgi:ABC-type antimicrobial peptide transport system permease subunit